MVDSQTTHRIQGTRWTLLNAFGVDAAQGVCRDCCTPDVTLSSIHYIRKLTLHHIMAYDHHPHSPHYYITHSLTQTKPHQTNYFNSPNQHVYVACSVHICTQPIYFACSVHMPSSHSNLYVLCSYADFSLEFYFIFRLFVFVHSLFRRVSSSSNSMLLVGLSVCFSRFVCF